MELSRPLSVITPTLDGDVLRVLALADADFTSGDIHRVLDGPSIRGIHNTLGRLTEQGIVSRRPAGRANLYRLACAPRSVPGPLHRWSGPYSAPPLGVITHRRATSTFSWCDQTMRATTFGTT
ncbi:MAG: hypothetical protein NTX29_00930 [Actinobacteria bacterium]|nr:hypothetical protein [Actinomycetota bacterium]